MTTMAMAGAARHHPRPLMVLTVFSVTLLALAGLWALGDARMVEGQPVWVKPAKFAASLAVFFGTLVWVEARLSPGWRDGWILRGTVAVMALAMLVEMAYIIVMSAQGLPSHFNLTTPLYRLMYSMMAIGALFLMIGVGVFGAVALADRGVTMTKPMQVAVGAGLIGATILTIITAMTMGETGRHVGIHPEGGAVIPFLGWSAVVGDLRPAHFLALHMMQVLPLAAAALGGRGGQAAIIAIAAGWVALTLAVFAQALSGLPLIAL